MRYPFGFILLMAAIACSHASHVQIVPGESGIVAIHKKDREKSRDKAIKLMEKNCGAGRYKIEKEGENLLPPAALADPKKAKEPEWQIKYRCNQTAATANAAGKPAQIPWEAVQIVDSEPVGCKFIQTIEAESIRIFFTVSNRRLNEKNAIKLKKSAAKIGANTVAIIQRDASMINSSTYAKAYMCK